MKDIEAMAEDGTFEALPKKEVLKLKKEHEKLEKNLGSIADLSRLPAALFVVDIMKEHIAVAEARKLNIPTFAIVDTNTNPNLIDFPIPANDDASKSIALIVGKMVDAIEEGITERKNNKDLIQEEEEEEVDEMKENVEEEENKDERRPRNNRRPRRPVAKN
jgi:small subunit ribosomal protein S2